nr:MAG TPA: hypothetical protein [Caudoviricetes sp.]
MNLLHLVISSITACMWAFVTLMVKLFHVL